MEKEKKTGRASLAMTIVLLALFVPVILINTALIVKAYVQPEHLPGIFGVKPVIVLSGSMSPLFEPDALIFVKETETDALKAGDVICYLDNSMAITHRIEQVVKQDGQTRYVTKGDANNTADRLAVSPGQVEGIYIGKIDGLGGVAMFMQSATGVILFIALPIALYLLYDILSRQGENRKDRQRADKLEAELLALRAEKEKKTTAK